MDPNKPRYLTKQEIDYILADFPQVHGVDKGITESVRQSLINRLRKYLADIQLTPLAINDLKHEIHRLFNKARIQPGSKVGFSAASSIGQLITQLFLNSFYTSGLAKTITTGVARIRELIEVTSNPKNPVCTIFYNRPMTFDDIVLDQRMNIVEITLADITLDYQIIDYEIQLDHWVDFFTQVHEVTLPQTDTIFRLYLDVSKLLEHRITLHQVARAITDHKPTQLIAVYSPMEYGIIDLYPITGAIKVESNIPFEYIPYAFFSSVIVPNLTKIKIKGISGIKNIFPAGPLKIDSAIVDSIKLADNRWRVMINDIFLKRNPITLDNVIQLFEEVNIKIAEVKDDTIEVISEDEPVKILRDKLSTEDNRIKKEESAERKKGNYLYRSKPNPIYNRSRLLYAETNGSNLLELLKRAEVNKRYTYSNNINEVFLLFGIEAARNLLISEYINNLLSEGTSPIDPRHITMIVEFQTNQGRLNPATYIGIQRQPTGALSKASFERSMDIFLEEAVFGRKEVINTISASIMTGKRAEIGTGIVNIQVDEEALAEIEKRTTPINPTDISKAIDQLNMVDVPEEEFLKLFKVDTTITEEKPEAKTVISTELPPTNPVSIPTVQQQSDLLVNAVNEISEIPCKLDKKSLKVNPPSIDEFLAE